MLARLLQLRTESVGGLFEHDKKNLNPTKLLTTRPLFHRVTQKKFDSQPTNFIITLHFQVIINRCKELARFALMHCIASSLCFWIWTILRETLDSLNSYAKYDDNADDDDRSEEGDLFENPVALPLTMNQKSKIRCVAVCAKYMPEEQARMTLCLSHVKQRGTSPFQRKVIRCDLMVNGKLYSSYVNIDVGINPNTGP